MDRTARQLRFLIDRLARLGAADAWARGLNPTQAAVLAYLDRANRFSRSPSHVADYLASTRGTVSQTLRALMRKGLVTETRSETDRRSIRYEVTGAGRALARSDPHLGDATAALDADRLELTHAALSDMLRQSLAARDMRSFGLCRSCTHHERRGAGGYCHLLKIALRPEETAQICHEHRA